MDTLRAVLVFLLSFDNSVQILNAELFGRQRSKIHILNPPHKVTPDDPVGEDPCRAAFILRM